MMTVHMIYQTFHYDDIVYSSLRKKIEKLILATAIEALIGTIGEIRGLNH